METGTVKFFDGREGKRFGFMTLNDGNELFFHGEDFELIKVGDTSPEFSGTATHLRDGKAVRMRDPRKDDVLVFERARGTQGLKAKPWGYNTQWVATEEHIAKRPKPPVSVYRVLQQFDSGTPSVEWQGLISELPRKYNRPHGRSASSDPLLSYYAHDDFISRHWWEKQLPDGSWEKCEDPRP